MVKFLDLVKENATHLENVPDVNDPATGQVGGRQRRNDKLLPLPRERLSFIDGTLGYPANLLTCRTTFGCCMKSGYLEKKNNPTKTMFRHDPLGPIPQTSDQQHYIHLRIYTDGRFISILI
jgi:hypothetical protein